MLQILLQNINIIILKWTLMQTIADILWQFVCEQLFLTFSQAEHSQWWNIRLKNRILLKKYIYIIVKYKYNILYKYITQVFAITWSPRILK